MDYLFIPFLFYYLFATSHGNIPHKSSWHYHSVLLGGFRPSVLCRGNTFLLSPKLRKLFAWSFVCIYYESGFWPTFHILLQVPLWNGIFQTSLLITRLLYKETYFDQTFSIQSASVLQQCCFCCFKINFKQTPF